MNMIMSRAIPHQSPFRGPPANQLPPQPPLATQSQRSRQTPNMARPENPITPTSPLDFTDRIPFHELKLSSETLGSGSFGTVFKGRWRGRRVAVKEFRTRKEIDHFFVEVQQLSSVKHPNIVTLYGASKLSECAYLVMEYAEGGSLNHLLHECQHQEYDLRHACSWAMQTARGVAYLHSIKPKKIMHRDLKPANLLLFSRGKILKLCDFGTACAVKTQMTNNTGSAPYMAPEVFTSEHYEESGDVFSWSIVFWEILTRCQPYNNLAHPNVYQILWHVTSSGRPQEIEGCPKPIWHLITRAWDMNPKKRPNMDEVVKEIEFILRLTEKRNYDGETRQASNSYTDKTRTVQQSGSACMRQMSPTASSRSSFRHPRPSLPSINSPLERLGSNKMTTIDHMFELRHNQDFSAASTSSSSSLQHYQNFPQDEQHYLQYHQQLSRRQDQSIQNRFLNTKQKKYLEHRVEDLRRKFAELEDRLQGDNKNTASISFEEFEAIKRRLKTMRHLLKDDDPRSCTSSMISSRSNWDQDKCSPNDQDPLTRAQREYARESEHDFGFLNPGMPQLSNNN